MRRYTLPLLVTGVLFAAGCMAGGGYATYGSAGYYGPELAYVSPGVQVVAGYEQPVFYSDNYYWRYDNNRWFRSSYHDRGWAYAQPPRAVLSIDRPYRYRNYRGNNGYGRRDPGRQQIRDHRNSQRPGYRQDRRTYQQPNRGQYRQAPARRGAVQRQAPVRGGYRSAPVQRQAPARDSSRKRVRDHRD